MSITRKRTAQEKYDYGALEEQYDFSENFPIKLKHVIAIILGFIFLLSYMMIELFAEWINIQIGIILSDWQLIMAFGMIIFLTIGWYVLQLIAILIFFFNDYVRTSMSSRTTNLLRYGVITFLVSILIFHFYFGFELENIMIWLFSFLILGVISLGILTYFSIRGNIRRKRDQPVRQLKPKRSACKEEDISEYFYFSWIQFALLLISVFIIIFLILGYIINFWGIRDFLQTIYLTIRSNTILYIIFWVMLLLTILWYPIKAIFLLIPFLAGYIIKTTVKRKINRTRILFIIFAGLVLFSKNILFLPLSPMERQLWSFITSFAITLVTFLVWRKLSK